MPSGHTARAAESTDGRRNLDRFRAGRAGTT